MKHSEKRLAEGGSTSPTLLREVADWHNHPAWVRFQGRYDPLLRRWCCGYGLDGDSIDEVCQRTWIELANRMRVFQYDPGGTFRGWLRRLCTSRVLDFLRQRQVVGVLSLDDREEAAEAGEAGTEIETTQTDEGEEVGDLFRLFLLEQAEKVQVTVRAKVKPQTWDAFWLVAVRDWTVERTAKTLGMTHTAVYAARARVARMLCDEGNRVSDRWPVAPDGQPIGEG
jgi:RNA polymerase sigma factor (sigma-70 family)